LGARYTHAWAAVLNVPLVLAIISAAPIVIGRVGHRWPRRDRGLRCPSRGRRHGRAGTEISRS